MGGHGGELFPARARRARKAVDVGETGPERRDLTDFSSLSRGVGRIQPRDVTRLGTLDS